MARYNTKLKPKQKPKRNLLPLWLALAGLGLILYCRLGTLEQQYRDQSEYRGQRRAPSKGG